LIGLERASNLTPRATKIPVPPKLGFLRTSAGGWWGLYGVGCAKTLAFEKLWNWRRPHGTPIVGTCQCSGSLSPLCEKIFFAKVLSPTGANNGEAYETRGNVTFVPEKAEATETTHHRKTAEDREASRYFKTANNQKAANTREIPSRCEAPTGCY
jgi:hypothetical protein